jgi:hypothetical protein
MAVGLVVVCYCAGCGLRARCCAGGRCCFDASWDEPLGQRSPVAAVRSGSGVDAAPDSAGQARATGGTAEGGMEATQAGAGGGGVLEVGRKDARGRGRLVTSSCFGCRCFDVPASSTRAPPCLPSNQARKPPPAVAGAVATLSPVLCQPHTNVYSRHVLSVIPCSNRSAPPYCILVREAAHTPFFLSSQPVLPEPCLPSRRSKPPRTSCPSSMLHRPVGSTISTKEARIDCI